MENPNPKPVKMGYRYGLVLLIFGLIMVGINYALLHFSNSYYPKILAIGIAISSLSLVFFVFPGGTIVKKSEGKDMNKELWNNAPGLHKAMWVIWGILSIALAIFALIKFDPQFYK